MYYLILVVYYIIGIIFFIVSDVVSQKKNVLENNELLDELI